MSAPAHPVIQPVPATAPHPTRWPAIYPGTSGERLPEMPRAVC
jgi:hypothetical protein